MDLNKVSEITLEETGFFNAEQINSILSHLKIYSSFVSINELRSLKGFTRYEADFYALIFTIKRRNSNLSAFDSPINLLSTEINYRFKRRFNKDVKNKDYIGSLNSQWLKINNHPASRIRYGLTLEKDEGEPYLLNKKPFIEFFSGFLKWNKSPLLNLTVGDYRIHIAQGLSIWHGMDFSKSLSQKSLYKSAALIAPYNGSDEHHFFRGIALSSTIKRFSIHSYLSSKKIDASVNTSENASTKDATFSSIVTSGLHRTIQENHKRDRVKEHCMGISLDYHLKHFKASISAIRFKYDKTYSNTTKSALYHNITTKGNNMLSFSFIHANKHILYSGELVFNELSTPSFVLLADINTGKNLKTNLSFRHFPKHYFAPYANTLSNHAKIINESGFYIRLHYEAHHAFQIVASYNQYLHPEKALSLRKNGSDLQFEGIWHHNDYHKTICQAKWGFSNEWISLSGEPLNSSIKKINKSLRLTNNNEITKRLAIAYAIELKLLNEHSNKSSSYFMFQQLSFYSIKLKSRFSIRFTSTIMPNKGIIHYAYEPGVPSAFNLLSYSKPGNKLSFVFKSTILKKVRLWLKVAHHITLTGIQSAPETKTNLSLQLTYSLN